MSGSLLLKGCFIDTEQVIQIKALQDGESIIIHIPREPHTTFEVKKLSDKYLVSISYLEQLKHHSRRCYKSLLMDVITVINRALEEGAEREKLFPFT